MTENYWIVNVPPTSQIGVSQLKLDLKNFYTVSQKKETDTTKGTVSFKHDRFYAVSWKAQLKMAICFQNTTSF